MAAINIRRDVKDSFYRYKMPRLLAKVEGRGNGIKTVIPNMTDISRSLCRPPAYPTKYFGCELGAQVKCEAKNDRYIVNGAHDAEKLQKLLDGFIDKFVLCGSCKNPETDLIITKDDIIRDCKACGQRTDVDMRHKLTTYILKNPPETKGKKNRGHADSGLNTPPSTEEGADGGSDDELTRRINADVAVLPTGDSLLADDDDWAEDTSPEAVAARMKELESSINTSLVLGDDDDDEGSGSSYELFGTWLEENRDASDEQIMEKMEEVGMSKRHRAVQVIAQALFDDDIIKQIASRSSLLEQLVKNEKDQKALLGGLERLIGITNQNLLPKTPVILKALYDEDLVDEEIFIKWGSKASKKYVDKETSKNIRKKAEPFITWLAEAEEEDSDEE
ncbi:translation initiation factor [Basidiobolus meristosporus CBS 931.73]|uniref:Translation initiation factor n=1 Tax=Basidiobolus meristosporus CBS 931.73 TaxID=1314790 RepID=A0A1Y1YLV8_9FUNG|nr:translation initiation factor [Basidiobolus meristosporus CBS 931.73]|eukprot:ORX98981.1 translation initiation factor [Basidiobolus meristosporus CBS 931.73]